MKNRLLPVLLSLMVLLFVSGCGGQTPKLGIVDKKKLMEESVYAEQIKVLDEQIAEFEQKLAAKKIQAQQQLQEKEEAINRSVQQTWQARVSAREQQLNQEIMNKHEGFFDQKEKEMKDYIVTVEDETNRQIDAYFAELQKPETSKEQADEIAKAIENAKVEATAKVEAKNEDIRSQIDARLAGDRQAMQNTLLQYASDVREELFAEHKKELDEFAEGLLGEEQKEQNQLKAQQIAVLKAADQHIKETVQTVAESKKLDTVFIEYISNAGAVDITEEVLQKLKAEGVKQAS